MSAGQTIDPRGLSDREFERQLKDAVKGSLNVRDAKKRIREWFSPEISVWLVMELDTFRLKVIATPFPTAHHYEVICDR